MNVKRFFRPPTTAALEQPQKYNASKPILLFCPLTTTAVGRKSSKSSMTCPFHMNDDDDWLMVQVLFQIANALNSILVHLNCYQLMQIRSFKTTTQLHSAVQFKLQTWFNWISMLNFTLDRRWMQQCLYVLADVKKVHLLANKRCHPYILVIFLTATYVPAFV